LLLAASVARGQDWHLLGAFWTEPTGGLTVLGGAVDLDGTAERFIEANAYSNIVNGATGLTVCAWVKSYWGGPYRGIVSSYGAGGTKIELTGYTASSNLFWRVGISGTNYDLVSSGPGMLSNGWSFVAGTWESGDKPVVWINGNSTTGAAAVAGAITQSVPFRYGHDMIANAYWLGLMDNTLIYRRRLTQSELEDLYNGGNALAWGGNFPSTGTPMTTDCVRAYLFDDASTATQALDSVSGYYVPGAGIGDGDWTDGIVPK
jgi:hypothetical protein